jgi:hypothetical protein
VLSFDAADPSCLDIYTNTATPYDEGSGVVLFFPSAFQHMDLSGDPTPHNDGLVDVRFGTARSVSSRGRCSHFLQATHCRTSKYDSTMMGNRE